MIRVLTFFLASALFFSSADNNKCVATASCLFCNSGQVLSLKNNKGREYSYNGFTQASVIDLYSFSCIINTVLFDNGTVLLLDNKLNDLQQMDLHLLGIYSPTQIAVEDINFFWVYDSFSNSLYRINRKLEQIDYRISLDYLTSEIKNLIFADNHLYFLGDDGIFSVDNLFNIHKEKAFSKARDFYVYNGRFFILSPAGIYYADSLVYPVKGLTAICGIFSDSFIVIRKGQSLLLPLP